MRSTASRVRGATSIPPPPCSITPSRDSRRPKPPRASAWIPIGRSRNAGRSLRSGVPGRDRPRVGLRAGRPAAERRGVERAVRPVAAARCDDAPTQRLAYGAGVSPPRLGGASRERCPMPPAAAGAAVEIAAAVVGLARLDRRCRDGRADAVALPAGDPHPCWPVPRAPKRPSRRRRPPCRRVPCRRRPQPPGDPRHRKRPAAASPAAGRRRR